MKLLNYINGQMVEPISQKWMDNTDLSTNTDFSQIPDSDERGGQVAVDAVT